MNKEEVEQLIEKVKNKTASEEERNQLLKQLVVLFEDVHNIINNK